MKKWMKLCCCLAVTVALLGENVGGISVKAAMSATAGESVSGSDVLTWEDVSGGDGAVEEEEKQVWELALEEIAKEREIMALVYLSDTYAVKEEADADSETVCVVPSGQTVFIEGFRWAENGQPWEYVRLLDGTKEYSGYVERTHLAVSDERFLAWETQYGTATARVNTAGKRMNAMRMLMAPAVSYADVEQFPASYQPALKELKNQHPNWIFVPMNTGLDWNAVIAGEIGGGKSLVYKTFPEYAKEGLYDSGNWYYASSDILKYYMDPRNGLSEEAIFQFEQLTYNATYHTEAAVEAFLNNTFMKSDQNAPGTSMTYAHIIWAIGAEDVRKVSPFHLAARIYQEQGAGTSPLISGNYPGYEGYYNYFNIRATGTTNQQIIESGLSYARDHGWSNAYYSILGGADVISQNYIQKGQDTLYLQKFNVNPQGSYALYTHQYMQNISAPTTEAKSIRNLYGQANSLNNTFVFKIPVFNNMPSSPCPMPNGSTDVVLQIPNGFNTLVYLDGMGYTPTARNGRYIVEAPNTGFKSAVVYQYNESGVPIGMHVWTLNYANGAYTATEEPELENLLTYHGFSIRITGKPGIRFKTGISKDTRSKLLTTGIDGFKLKEYGTLVMNRTNMAQYPMVKGGEKVLDGLSYGTNENGVHEDKVYEIVQDRYRYTSVLVGQPASQYKTEYAFRGYIILEKDGVETKIYGPSVAKSIYELAGQVIAAGTYPEGSDADVFLRKLISDADALEQEP